MGTLSKISLLLVIVLVSLSAYLRLAHSGIGCEGWPDCYGRIGEAPAVSQYAPADDAYQRLLEQRNQPLSWATPLHRLVASVLGLLILFLAFLSFKNRRQRVLSLALLSLTIYLAVLGIRSGSLHDPAVVMGNLAGGFAMLGLLGWMVFSAGDRRGGGAPAAILPVIAIVVLAVQILLGGLTSANFAATSCRTLPDCHGSWWPGSGLAVAMDLSRTHEITPGGQAIGGEERLAVHKAHRIGSILTLAACLLAAFSALRAGSRYRAAALFVMACVMAEFGLGIAAILSGLPIGLAVAHNWFAGLLLLGLMKLLALGTSSKTNA